jgi:Fe-Mn family superoxide dismutase
MKPLTLPVLPYAYEALEPIMSAETLRLHHDKHHQAYVDGANKIIGKLNSARTANEVLDMKALLKELSFHLGGHLLHNLFWKIMRAPQTDNRPSETFLAVIKENFGSWERFQAEFEQTATSVEGSGWAALMLCPSGSCLALSQIEKHNTNNFVGFTPLLAIDVWEHAYYVDHRNNRAQFVKNFWQIINWDEVENLYTKKSSAACC